MFSFRLRNLFTLFTVFGLFCRNYSFEVHQSNELHDFNGTHAANQDQDAWSANSSAADFLNSGLRKKPFQQQSFPHISKLKVEVLSKMLKIHVDQLRDKTDQVELVFLVDASASVGLENFRSELNFVRKLLADFTVAREATRVAIVTFAGKTNVIRHVDQISSVEDDNHKCNLLNHQIGSIEYTGGGTYTRGALLEALDILQHSRSGARTAVFLVTDGFSNGGDPRPAATLLKNAGVIVFTFGIRTGNIGELHDIASEPGYAHSYLLNSFPEFEALARRALHHDLQSGEYIKINFLQDCDLLCSKNSTEIGDTQCCDVNASCACGTATGHYACLCHPGYFGSGFYGSCQLCPNGTFGPGNIPGDSNAACIPCPDLNHVTIKSPAISLADCVCAAGFTTNGNKCEAITCPKLKVPENGYLVKASACNNVVNAACGVRCKIGFHLTGDSIRLCLNSGAWSGTQPQCLLKTCPALQAPPHGKIRCEHEDDHQVINAGLSAYPIDTHCEYKCDIGYQLRGSRARNCLPLSRWDGLRVSCRPIKCHPLRSVPNGEIIPPQCTGYNKLPFATKCTIRCKEGFTRTGPENKVCAGLTGSWLHRHNVTQCIDSTPPNITCPSNITVETLSGKNYSMVNWTKPLAIDNAKAAPMVWTEPAVEAPWKFGIGTHVVTYIAQDASKNRAECKFSATVIDKEPPTVENCVDPPIFLLENKSMAINITWDEPVFYDNSGHPLEISKSHTPGTEIFNLGTTQIVYNATDKANNTRTCTFNITVEDVCENVPSPTNGHSDCSVLQEGIRCVVVCAEGYGFVLPETASYIDDENVTLTCNNGNHSWNNEVFPDCSVTQVPYAISQDLTVVLDTNTSNCNDPTALNSLSQNIKAGLESQLKQVCDDEVQCNISQSAFDCNGGMDEDSNASNTILNTSTRKLRRSVKRFPHSDKIAVRRGSNSSKNHTKSEVKWDKIELKYKIIGKMIDDTGNNSNQEIIQLKKKIEAMMKGGYLSLLDNKTSLQEISKQVLRLYVIFEEPKELCSTGSVLKKHRCVKCPSGTFHNTTKNRCQSCPLGEYQEDVGSSTCKKCPEHTSTKRKHSKRTSDCLNFCRPGYYSRRKRHHKSTLAFEPCVTCAKGFYQPDYAQLKCIPCPANTTTYNRGSYSIDECLVIDHADKDPCHKNPCHNGGKCVPVGSDFKCECIGDFIGSKCEIRPNPCDSLPCLNEGQCIALDGIKNSIEHKCLCKSGFTGINCETYIDECSTNPCRNGGSCISTEVDYKCICKNGFEGDNCEVVIDHCKTSICESGSKCHIINGTWQCICKPGFLGRRCSRLPCDWLPCHQNAVCVNIEELNATKKSYRCECPEGYTGIDCTTRVNHCEDLPCMNNGTCMNNFSNFSCECRKEFNGSKCENELSSRYTMYFPKSGTTDYVMLSGPNKNLSQFTVCLWLQSLDTVNYGTVLSYATRLHDNALTLTDYNGFVIYINGNRVVTDITANDGYWHFVCVTWENVFGFWQVFVDGIVRENGTQLASETLIEGNGTLVIGQEQDRMGGGFSESESLLGKLSSLDIWDEVLNGDVIKKLSQQCETYHGSLYSWAQLQQYVRGNIEIQNSSFCHACSLPKAPFKGQIEVNYDASEIVYTCEKGYLVKFGKKESAVLTRRCLKQGQWEGYSTPTCTKVKCGFPGYFPRGQVHGRSYSYGDQIHYSCKKRSTLRGNPNRICTAHGKWSGVQPLCISKTCKNLLAPDNGDIEYLIEDHERNDTSILQVGQQLAFICNPGFRVLGNMYLTCMENGEWDNAVPKCIAFGCPPPELMENAFIASNISTGVEILPAESFLNSQRDNLSEDSASLVSGYFYGDIVGFSCRQGFKFFGNHNMIAEFRIQCTNNGSWNGLVPSCVPLRCLRPEPIKNGKYYLLTSNNSMAENSGHGTFGNLTFVNRLVPISTEPLPDFHGHFDIPVFTDKPNSSDSQSNMTKNNTMPEDFQIESNASFILGARISITCNKGYKLIGASIRQCTNNETWSPDASNCEPRECNVENHPIINVLSTNREEITFDGEIEMNIKNQSIVDIFRANKYIRGTLQNFIFKNTGNVFGDTISLTCVNDTKIHFDGIGINRILRNVTWKCNENGVWEIMYKETSNEDFQRMVDEKKETLCRETVCGLPKTPRNGYIVDDITNSSVIKVGDSVMFKCRNGHMLAGDESAQCLSDGTWSPIPNCESVTCGKPPIPRNTVLNDSSAEISGYVSGNMVSYRCVSGYKMYGRGNARCLASGKWSRMSGRCSRITCGKPAIPPGVEILGPSYLYEAQLAYICPDQIIKGKITCKSDGKWSELPDCTALNIQTQARK
ncbi:sushi, von Willebrand factor type A, EGF and pentraxin domain-containing protein 1 isoform X1 [Neodiprion pinetum]|uniref:sushi, von Willebrand factor type A, EGF and pentraxin domain-containing protein 1 isoform X1 n=1 Tax=Neodiprion pinetum TaxID=441929 RepID=UPI001EE0EB15|nr:sushi, von Willebrand factor type A, EGF and pentraxin domain-containing protein 1-like isoform X1 [Neodiprion pinetum]XP_046472082.1 sushi, von Willebrand factor type A, EGF and pentraxin domain-containing protein 1-like isoform X1 [Neodiprion pinetum]